MDAVVGVLHRYLNVYYGVELAIGVGFFGASLVSGPFLVFSNQQVADASLLFFCFGIVSLFLNNILGAMERQIDTSGNRPALLEWMGRGVWSLIVFGVHAVLLAVPLYLGYRILYSQ
ncbi:MAG: hypothetical protein RIC56_03025 [Pseudomonadales bacterium]